MKKLVYYLNALFVLVLLLSGCVGADVGGGPAVSAPAEEASGSQPTTPNEPVLQDPLELTTIDDKGNYDPQEIAEVCPIPSIQARMEAYQRLPLDKPIYWTFHMNFRRVTKDNKKPIGCFRLFERNKQTNAYEPVAQGTVIAPCEIKSNLDSSKTEGVTIRNKEGQAEAEFDGNGHIECVMQIKAWTLSLRDNLRAVYDGIYDVDVTTLDNLLNNFINTTPQLYDNFTMMADVMISNTKASLVPFIYYEPIDGRSYGLSVVKKDDGITFGSDKCLEIGKQPLPYYEGPLQVWESESTWNTDHRAEIAVTNTHVFDLNVRQTFWWDHRTPIESEKICAVVKDDGLGIDLSSNLAGTEQCLEDLNARLLRLPYTQLVQKGFLEETPYNRCVIASATAAALVDPNKSLQRLSFSIEEATLYIGYWPSENTPISFTGTMYAIDIDPGDSKPPASPEKQ